MFIYVPTTSYHRSSLPCKGYRTRCFAKQSRKNQRMSIHESMTACSIRLSNGVKPLMTCTCSSVGMINLVTTLLQDNCS